MENVGGVKEENMFSCEVTREDQGILLSSSDRARILTEGAAQSEIQNEILSSERPLKVKQTCSVPRL